MPFGYFLQSTFFSASIRINIVTYVFKVNKDATKTEIKKATEEIFGVVVKSIRVLNTKFKNKRTRFGKYKTKTFKKAYIKLEEGKEINRENPFK